MVAGTRHYDYRTFDEQAGRVAAYFAAQGIGAGDTVGFYLHNTAEFLIAFYACLKLEATPAPMNYRYRAAEIAELVDVAAPRAFLYRASSRAKVRAAQHLLGERGPQLWLEIDDGEYAKAPQEPGPEGALSFEALLQEQPEPLPHRHLSKDAELYIFTGGTTGRPKAVVWGLGDLMDIQETSTYTPLGLTPPQTLEQAVDIATDPRTPVVRTLPLAPFIHATALFMSANTLNVGGTVVVNPNPSLDADAAADLAVKHQVTQLVVAGDAVALPIAEALERHPERERLAVNSVMSSGMRFGDETKARLHRLRSLTVMDILASSEGGPFAMAITGSEDDLPARFRLTADAVVLDDSLRQVQTEVGAKGILAFRGALPKGYLNDPEKSRDTYPVIDGVRHARPGDYVQVLDDGYIEFLGRGSAVINTGGEKVFPAEVEEVLLEFDGVHDAVVFGLPDQRLGERVSAVVAVDEGASVTPEALQEWVGSRLAGYKKPRTIVVRDSLERTPAGKLNMRRVKETASRAVHGETAS